MHQGIAPAGKNRFEEFVARDSVIEESMMPPSVVA
jgi:hypothetical protein